MTQSAAVTAGHALTGTAPPPRQRGRRGGRTTPWGTVLVLAVLLAVADSFVVTVVQGAVGAIERNAGPFLSWMETAAVVLPLFVLVVLGALAVARRWLGPDLHSPGRVTVAALLVGVAAALLGTGVLVANTAYDYHVQSQQLSATEAHLGHNHGVSKAVQLGETLAAEKTAAREAGRVIVIADLVIVAWVAAMRGGRLDVTARARRATA